MIENNLLQRTNRPAIDDGMVFVGLVISAFVGVLGLTGLAIGAVGLLKAFRRKMSYSDVPATELDKRRLAQAASAATASASAGANAWRQASPTKN